jgi:serine/threonine protein kinase
MIGTVISHYSILEKLGEGGMGVVYKAMDTRLDRIVALKFMPHHVTPDQGEEARFLQEAKAASALNHPNVCTIYSIQEEGGNRFIDMEYIEGVTLRQKLPVAVLSEAIGYAVQIGDALHEAHQKGVVHRDIKSDNIMINTKNQVKVMDFGLAKLKGSLKITKATSTVGTLAYMAPEQIQGGNVDARSDIFSFGAVLYEMLTGKLPFRTEHEAALMYSIINDDPEPIQNYRSDLSPVLTNLIQRALEKDPNDRYQSINEMVIELRRLQKQSTRVSRTSLASMPIPSQEMQTRPAGIPAGPVRGSSTKILIITGLCLLAGVAAVLYKLFIAGEQESASESFRSIKIARLTTSGKASLAAISPDGKYVAHVVVEGERHSLWMRQVATTSNVMIVPPNDVNYIGVTFSNDGDFVYYVVLDDNNPNGTVFEIPVLGGSPRKVLSDLATAVTFSPDGQQMAFIRQIHAMGEDVLMVANVDGSGERKLSTRRGDDYFITDGVAPSWSPDGKLIAAPAASDKRVQHVNLIGYSPKDGSEKLLSQDDWGIIGKITWCDRGRGIAFVNLDRTSLRPQLWYLQYPDGSARRITNDLSEYDPRSLSITADGAALVSTTVDYISDIWILTKPEKGYWDGQIAAQIPAGSAARDGLSGLAWTLDHRIVFTSNASDGVAGLWIMDRDGANQRQLSPGSHEEIAPDVSPDGKIIVFDSARDTTPHIWRMDIDGGNAAKLSFSEDYSPSVTADGKWVIYFGWATGKALLYKAPLAGGEPVSLSLNPASYPRPSADGRSIVCRYFNQEENKWGFALLASADAHLQRFFDLPNSVSIRSLRWYPDAKSITYVDTRNGVSNIWSMPASGGESRQLTNFTSGLIYEYAWSRDGKYLAVARGQVTSDVVLITNDK